jgi:transcriptional regulator with XRE-family HTH domain
VERKAKVRPARRNTVPLLREFGAVVRRLRNERGWSLERFAAEARLHWTYVAGVERGERNLSLINIGKLATALKVPLADLFHDVATKGRGGT